MKKRILTLLLAALLCVTVFAGCKSDPQTATSTEAAAPPASGDGAAEAGSELEPYTFTLYYNYDWWTIRPWGEDESSKALKEKFNITVEQAKPDADADAKLNLMISSGDLPDAIQMDRGANNMRMAQLGLFQDLAPLQANNPSFDENILQSTQDLLKIDGTLYAVPHWARKGATGGNDVWMYNQRLYEAAGSPDLSTFEGLYEYAKYIKDNVPTTEEGLPTISFATENNANAHDKIVPAFYRSMGGPNKAEMFTARIDGKIQSVFRDPVWKDAVLEANKWYREGLISETQFTDTNDQMIEKFVAGRTALLYYDFSQDDVNRFRTILMETYEGDSYEIITDPVYPPAAGVNKVYADGKETIGWNVINITKEAEQPQRIFDLLSYMLTKEGSINMMYGPQGDWWDELDSNGNPVLNVPENQLPSTEKDRIGAWFWNFMAHSDNVDMTKFAVNAMQPIEEQSWVISAQADVVTPLMFVTDEYVNLNTLIDPLSDLGIQKKLIEDQIKAELPKMIMASSAEQCEQQFADLLQFMENNNLAEIESIFDEYHQEIVSIQGGSAYDN